jgi:hypothetical protein
MTSSVVRGDSIQVHRVVVAGTMELGLEVGSGVPAAAIGVVHVHYVGEINRVFLSFSNNVEILSFGSIDTGFLDMALALVRRAPLTSSFDATILVSFLTPVESLRPLPAMPTLVMELVFCFFLGEYPTCSSMRPTRSSIPTY